jgi:hypothetical protein
MTLDKSTIDKLFCLNSKKYGIPKLWLKAVAMTESSMLERSYRYEPGFWSAYLKDNPEWKDQDPAVVSASYGLMQLMWTTAWGLGFRGTQEDLWNPVYNIELGAKLIAARLTDTFIWHSPLDIAMARYNGGRTGNPGDKGVLRNAKYVAKVRRNWEDFKAKETECE